MDPVAEFKALPRRLFLDTSTVQTLCDYGEFVWDGGGIAPGDRITRIPEGLTNLASLRDIFFVNQRAQFEVAVSNRSLQEAAQSYNPAHLCYAEEVLQRCRSWALDAIDCVTEASVARAALLDSGRSGYLGTGDRALMKDAVSMGCAAFITMERRLPKNAAHLQRTLGIRVLSPSAYWSLLRPWAALYV